MTVSLAQPPGIREGISEEELRFPWASSTTEETAMLFGLPKPLGQTRFRDPGGEPGDVYEVTFEE